MIQMIKKALNNRTAFYPQSNSHLFQWLYYYVWIV